MERFRKVWIQARPVVDGSVVGEAVARPVNAGIERQVVECQAAAAQLSQAAQDVTRYTPLAQEKAISQETLDNAVQGRLAAQAAVAAAQASVEQAGLNRTRIDMFDLLRE